ncbi:MAG: N-acetyl-gamma-glutamyl-phosphate reductase [candidate division KSB1 bacterium]|nr:N-acetyl-gamma-glutamyl-phosphate reductase [candidate division KSB1 bacterium]
MLKVSIVGGSGYVGGEVLRLLLGHPKVELVQVTSQSRAGKFVHSVHPNLRKRTSMKFTPLEELRECDLLFVALPHGMSMDKIESFLSIAPKIIDLSADFRLRNPQDYIDWYEKPHTNPAYLEKFVYGLPELHREEIKRANLVTGAGCLATAAILGLMPLFKENLVANDMVFIEGKMGSSGAGENPSLASHHSERSGAVRSFKPTGHRHTAEITQELSFPNKPKVFFSATAIELVRGILITGHVLLKDNLEEKDIWRVYRNHYGNEPFIRIVKESGGIYRYPEPKILIGSNFCDIGFEKEAHSQRLVVMSAIDNLMKGAAGNGVQAMNLMAGFEETLGLEFPGLHPI